MKHSLIGISIELESLNGDGFSKLYQRFLKAVGVLFLLVLTSCTWDCDDPNDQECSNYDPCLGKLQTSAYFVVEESIANDYWVESDTISGRGNKSSVRFTAINPADSIIWHIGSEIVNEQTFIRQGFPAGQWIEVLLVVFNKKPDKDCFPDDDGIDSFVRKIYVWPRESYWDETTQKYIINNPFPIQGSYIGVFQSDPHNEVEISFNDSSIECFEQPEVSTVIENIPKGYYKPYYTGENCGYFSRSAWVSLPHYAFLNYDAYPEKLPTSVDGGKVIRVSGTLQLNRNLKDVEITLEYFKLNDPIQVLARDRFIGQKIN